MTITYNRGLVLAATETTFNVEEALSASTDAFEAINPDFTPDIQSQVREVAPADLSPFETLVTRKLGGMSFSLEVKSNGNTDATVAPRIGRLLQACGMSETQINTAFENVFRTVGVTANTGDLNFYGSTTAYTGGVYLKIKCTIVTGGGSGVAVAHFEHEAEATTATQGIAAISMTDTDEVLLTDGAEITLHDNDGNPLISITPDFQTTNPSANDVFYIHVRPNGYLYKPASENIDSVTLKMQFPDDSGQSITHVLTGARGTFTVNAAVGGFPTFDFEFTGTYNNQVDEATLTGTFETTTPVAVEYAAMALAQKEGDKEVNLCSSSWTIDIANDVQIRDCINALASSQGAFITGRAPTFNTDPESVLASIEPIWSYLENGTSVEYWVRHGVADGNLVLFHAPNAQLTNIGYADRNNIRTFAVDGSFARLNGNDELEVLFT